ncbi:hypothetical protein MBM_06896 [Drepanopeziza brunnea f. sp. 'multigermtubi' MB_m1]|uniref:Uncharacterized protein n=1 Tax=Marssonina brunnea f. sp. multigermtubi (strain MB_m1) TaxID=1072389 RepID=K1WCS1_MARBU|nr:uncharacterized protein MBM_06896 [Drepanopeziza brunnea f. sp. 'multigermtubi' MB_m1]EKD15135.1 hypothetical protein MBM_06896 [Drepanopeziza brunnea f. sp. 'multigermtubi' MB_m1]
MQERDVNNLKNYYRTFSRISERFTSMHLLSKTEQGRLFFFGLPVGIRNKTIKHYKVDELDLDSYAVFDDFVAFAFKTDQSARTIEAMNREKARASQESSTAVEIDLKDRLFDSIIKKEFSRLAAADEAIEDVEGEVEITQRVLGGRKKRTYRREKFIDLYVIIKAQEKAMAVIIKSRIEV